jgi:parvulin-like peptidyl-prolyl isomerase
MRNRFWLWLVLVLLALGAGALAAQEVVEEIVAVVNDDCITLSQYQARYETMVRILQSQFQGEEYDRQLDYLKKNLMDQMVSELLLLQMAQDNQYDVREQVKAYVDNIKKQNNIESDEDLKRALAREGLDYDTWLKQTQEDILRQMVIYNEVDSHIVIDDASSMAYYKSHLDRFTLPAEYKLRAIVLPQESGSESALEERRKEISARLAQGADFAQLASEYDQGALKESGGDLGLIKKPELDPTLAAVADKLQPKEVTSWFKGRNGWYLLELEERTDSRVQTFTEVKKDVELQLYQEKKAKGLDDFFAKLKAANYVKIVRPDPLGF